MMKKRVMSCIIALVLSALSLNFITRLLMPKYVSVAREGNLISEYYAEIDAGREHQVIFVGDCEVYESFVPPLLWEEFGITSYVRGSPQQLVWQSYYLLCEMLEYEAPEAVVFNVLSMKYGKGQNEAYNRMTLDGMRWSEHKYWSVRESLTEDESVLSYLFPLLRFHSRWQEVDADDIEYAFSRPTVSHNGYLLNSEVRAQTDATQKGEPLMDCALPKVCFEYLDKMTQLCDSRGVELILIKAPTNTWRYWWYDEWDVQIVDYAESRGIDYYNFINEDGIGIDMSRDTYDGGVHLNVYGAEKLTKYFGELLRVRYGIEDMRGDADTASVWQEKLDRYKKERKGDRK